MPAGTTLNAKLGIESAERVYLRRPEAKVRSVIKWDLSPTTELVEGEDLPHPPVDVALTWIDDDTDLAQHLDEVQDRVPPEGYLWAVVRSPRHRTDGFSRTRKDVLDVADALGLSEGDVVHLNDTDMAVRLVPSDAA